MKSVKNFTHHFFAMDDNETVDVHNNERIIESLANFTWWYVVIMAAVGMVLNLCGAVYLLTTRCSGSTVLPCMVSVIIADCVFLASVLGGLVVAEWFPNFPGSVICKVMTFSTNTTSLFSNWCWVILWGGRYLAVFHPWAYYRYKYYSKMNVILPTLLLLCVSLECWTLIYATEVDYNCDLDDTLASYDTFKYLFLAESTLAFFLPFSLIMIADIRVFSRRPTLKQMEPTDLCTDSFRPSSTVERVMIVSKKYKRDTLALKHRMIRRFVVLASVDLLFNFPNVIIHLVQAFQRGSMSSVHQANDLTGYAISAVSYSLFYLQYVLNIVHIRLLISDYVKQNVCHSSLSGSQTPTKHHKDLICGNSLTSGQLKIDTEVTKLSGWKRILISGRKSSVQIKHCNQTTFL